MSKSKKCPICGEVFNSVFDATDHLIVEGEGPFDPSIILPSGWKIRVGSILREMHAVAADPEHVRDLCEQVYGILYLAEYEPDDMDDLFFRLNEPIQGE